MYETMREQRIIQRMYGFNRQNALQVLSVMLWLIVSALTLLNPAEIAPGILPLLGVSAIIVTLKAFGHSAIRTKEGIIIKDDGLQIGKGKNERAISWMDIGSWRWSDPATEHLVEQLQNTPTTREIRFDHTPDPASPDGWVLVIQPNNGGDIQVWAADCIDPKQAEAWLRSALVCNCPHQVVRDPHRGIVHVHKPEMQH